MHVRWPPLQVQSGGPIGDFRDVDDGELDGVADLLSGQPNTASRAHGFEHVVDEPFERRSDLFNPASFLAQYRMAILNNFKNHVENWKPRIVNGAGLGNGRHEFSLRI